MALAARYAADPISDLTDWIRHAMNQAKVLGLVASLRSPALGDTSRRMAMDIETSPGDPSRGRSRSANTPATRQMLWVDGVGGYLVCLGEETVLGHPGGDASWEKGPDVGLLADISSRHAGIRRVEGGWLLIPRGAVAIDGKPIDGPTLLEDGVEVRLGEAVRMRFRKPHSLSTTAVVTVESGQRVVTAVGGPAADALLLMAESCVLGPKPHSHVRCPKWSSDVILFRGSEGLLCRADGEVSVNSEVRRGPIVVAPGTRIEGQDFAFSVEGVEERG